MKDLVRIMKKYEPEFEASVLKLGIKSITPLNVRLLWIFVKKLKGTDCYDRESESAEIKGWLRDTTILPESDDQKILEAIQELFPQEYGEYLDEATAEIIRKCKRPLNQILLPTVKPEGDLSDKDLDRIRYQTTEYIPHREIRTIEASPDKFKDIKITLVDNRVFYSSKPITTNEYGISGIFFNVG